MIFSKGEPLKKVPTDRLVDELFAEIDRYYESDKTVVRDAAAAEEARAWWPRNEDLSAMTPEAARRDRGREEQGLGGGDDVLNALKPAASVDEASSPRRAPLQPRLASALAARVQRAQRPACGLCRIQQKRAVSFVRVRTVAAQPSAPRPLNLAERDMCPHPSGVAIAACRDHHRAAPALRARRGAPPSCPPRSRAQYRRPLVGETVTFTLTGNNVAQHSTGRSTTSGTTTTSRTFCWRTRTLGPGAPAAQQLSVSYATPGVYRVGAMITDAGFSPGQNGSQAFIQGASARTVTVWPAHHRLHRRGRGARRSSARRSPSPRRERRQAEPLLRLGPL